MIRDFPHTVCVEEMKTIVTVQEAERMDKKRKKIKGTLPDDGIRRYLYFAVIPVVVLILVVVILHSDKKKDAGQTEAVAMTAETGQPVELNEGDPAGDESNVAGNDESESAENAGEENTEAESTDAENTAQDGSDEENTESVESSEAADNADATDVQSADPSEYTLKQDEMPELTALVQSYCQAKTDCDPEALQQLFGVTDLSEDQIAAEREKMELVKASIKAYKNISCYYIEGAEADSYVIFPYFEIQYRKAAKLMPTLTWGYVKKQEDGQYRMVSELSDTEKEYVKAVGERADVKELQDQVEEAAAAAVSEDEVLQQVYTHNGSSEVSIGTQEQ